MMLTLFCPNCKTPHEMNCTPEPDQLCPECAHNDAQMRATVVLKLDGGNTRVQKSEIEKIVESAKKEAEKYHIKLDDYTYDR